ncbi:riboflavin kinase / FMN adenylyltransferase [Ketogulonicigenium robustum]|uniref:Riboflavin biosynthesis protein n=1 Tax=Ketogulonicigenium robustum TaxID=92947 RepID=A0A1W6NXV3_9RHOB|nr:bifunctional riboflavin kinase/FAD synthetase [Ketogulonicigenium robustum]ARO14075.1 riboflavin kinase / FMN adenylyltransferase [Ketogulonicigenium robustum]
MDIIRDSLFIAPDQRGAVVAIGNFDGVHAGHSAVIDHARRIAAQLGAPLGVLTFEPHPRQFFAPDGPDFRLMDAATRTAQLQECGVERLYELPFNTVLAGLTAEEFVAQILHDRLGVRHVVVGQDFHFGKGRTGSAERLTALGAEMGFGVTVAPLIALVGGEVSSTAIRQALAEGRPRDAAAMLGHIHRLEGIVEHGDQRGRELGFPTANISISGLHMPRFGVYATAVIVRDGPYAGRYKGATSIGIRPTFGVNKPNCETFLLDFRGDLYGARISVGLVEYLRPELKFDSVDALIDTMHADVEKARRILADV